MRPDPRCYGMQRRLKAQGLHAEVVAITSVLPNHSQIVCKRPDGKRKTFTIDNRALIDRLTAKFLRPGALPSPAVLYAQSRAELLTNRFFVWLPDEGEPRANTSRANRNGRESDLRVQSGDRRRRDRNARPTATDQVPRLF